MKIQYISDLHLEFSDNRKFLRENPIKPSGDILVIAGDLAYLTRHTENVCAYQDYADEFLDYFSKNWKYTIIVPGNHEYYGGIDSPYLGERQYLDVSLRPNVRLLNNRSIYIAFGKDEDIQVIDPWMLDVHLKLNYKIAYIMCTTLWSFIPYEAYSQIMTYMNDYINCWWDKNSRISIGRVIELHYGALDFLQNCYFTKQLSKNIKTVIVTHHLPSPDLLTDKYKNPFYKEINHAYASDLNDLIKDMKPNAWVCGHAHGIGKYKIGQTKLFKSCLGYINPRNLADIKNAKKSLNTTFAI